MGVSIGVDSQEMEEKHNLILMQLRHESLILFGRSEEVLNEKKDKLWICEYTINTKSLLIPLLYQAVSL